MKAQPPFGLILYYIFTFVVMVILLNILIALYNSAYEDITANAIDEYMALVCPLPLFLPLSTPSNTVHSLVKRPCSSSALPTKTSLSRPST